MPIAPLPHWECGNHCGGCHVDEIDCAQDVTIGSTRFVRLHGADGDTLYLTKRGWSLLEYVLPHRWYEGGRYFREGSRLPDSTGNVFRLDLDGRNGLRELVIKINRVGQEAYVDADISDGLVGRDEVGRAAFLDPFREFAFTMQLAETPHPVTGEHLRVKWPLAIYRPAEHLKPYQIGRQSDLFARAVHDLAQAIGDVPDDHQIHLHEDTRYICVYRWIKGTNAADLVRAGLLGKDECQQLVRHVYNELEIRGFHILDLKPTHIICREHDGEIVRDRQTGLPLFGLVDFELLTPVIS